MQFRIPLPETAPSLPALEQALLDADPTGLLDVDESGRVLRVSTLLDVPDLVASLERGGLAAAADAVERVPSECCGGCGG